MSIQLSKNLIMHLPLDEQSLKSATVLGDRTPHGNDGTSANVPVFVADRMGQSNKAIAFNGTTDTINCGSSQSLSNYTGISISAWVRLTTTGIAQGIITKGETGSMAVNRDFDLFFSTNNKIGFICSSGTGYILILSSTNSLTEFDTGIWYHVVAVWDGTTNANAAKLYVNDNIEQEGTATGSITTMSDTHDVYIGGDNRNLSGAESEVRIYNRAINTAEVTALSEMYRPGINLGTLQKGLVMDLPLDSTWYNAGITTFKNRTPHPIVAVNNGGDVDTDHTTFVSANSDYVRVADADSLDIASTMSVFCWVKGSSQSTKGILNKWDSTLNKRSFLLRSTDILPYRKINIGISEDGTFNSGHIKFYRSSIDVFNSTWHLIGFSFNAGILKLYVDGVEDTNVTKSADFAITTIFTSDQDLTIGSILNNNTPTGFFSGDLAKPRIYNRVLSNAEWLLYYEQNKHIYQ